MKRSPSALPVFLQVAILVVLSIVAAQAVAFGLILYAPPPEPTGFTIEQAALALRGEPAETPDGRPVRRSLSDAPPFDAGSTADPLARVLALSLEAQLGLPRGAVRVRLAPPHTQMRHRLHAQMSQGARVQEHVVVNREERRVGAVLVQRSERVDRADAAAETGDDVPGWVTITAEHLRFPPFTATARLADGQWATVRPPGGGLSPWQGRILLGFTASLLLLAPLAWWIARRLTRPIRVFAEAAERLGADPHAPPLPVAGPVEVRNAAIAFNDMQDRLRRYIQERTQMVAAIAHDLRTPLTRLRFRAEQAPEAVRDRMAADIDEMDALIRQAMAFGRGEGETPRAALDLASLTRGIVRDYAETGAKVALQGKGRLPVTGDAIALRRAVTNLIDNAVKFAGAARVSIAARDGMAVVEVADDGPGLPESELEAVFEPFRRGERSRSRKTGGAGLGLSVARQAARAHGGEVVLEPGPGGGLVARLTLPLDRG